MAKDEHNKAAEHHENAAKAHRSAGPFQQALLYAPSLEKAGVGRVLLDVGGLTLFCGVHLALYLRHVLN
jgi:hypothetical protein